MSSLTQQARAFSSDIKLAHSVFALPFALAAGWIVAVQQPVPWLDWVWIVVAMVGARSSAMGFNRVIDRRIDSANPRTSGRAIPSGALSPAVAWGLTIASAALFVVAAALLDPLCLWLSPIVIGWLWGYSLTKRFTALCHLWLGAALGMAPPAVWIALTGTLTATPLLLAGGVLTWVAGFDILYSLQDREFDAGRGLHSIPVALGERGALWTSRLLHVGTVGLLAAIPLTTALAWPYLVGCAIIAGVLAWEHSLVKPGDLSRLDKAFFSANGYVSLLFLVTVVVATLV